MDEQNIKETVEEVVTEEATEEVTEEVPVEFTEEERKKISRFLVIIGWICIILAPMGIALGPFIIGPNRGPSYPRKLTPLRINTYIFIVLYHIGMILSACAAIIDRMNKAAKELFIAYLLVEMNIVMIMLALKKLFDSCCHIPG